LDTVQLNSSVIDDAFQNWIADLEKRHLAELTFSEVSRALRALSSTYVERRHKIVQGGAFSGAGKRAAFALFYAPLHFLLVREIARSLGDADASPVIVDVGCGTGAAGAAVAGSAIVGSSGAARVLGIDRNRWALDEAARTYRAFSLRGQTRQGDAATLTLPPERATVVAAFTLNEMPEAARNEFLARLLDRARACTAAVLVVEPIGKSAVPWWGRWRDEFLRAGGRADEWRFRVELPPIVAKLDRAAGLKHQELTGRSLLVGLSGVEPPRPARQA
jgi:hypothetical protein